MSVVMSGFQVSSLPQIKTICSLCGGPSRAVQSQGWLICQPGQPLTPRFRSYGCVYRETLVEEKNGISTFILHPKREKKTTLFSGQMNKLVGKSPQRSSWETVILSWLRGDGTATGPGQRGWGGGGTSQKESWGLSGYNK